MFFGQASLRHAVTLFVTRYHGERNHQGLENRLLQPLSAVDASHATVKRRERLGALRVRPYGPGDVGWAIELHGQLYADELDWNEEFEALVATLFAKFATQHQAGSEQFWVAAVDNQRAGCVFVVRSEKNPGRGPVTLPLSGPHFTGTRNWSSARGRVYRILKSGSLSTNHTVDE